MTEQTRRETFAFSKDLPPARWPNKGKTSHSGHLHSLLSTSCKCCVSGSLKHITHMLKELGKEDTSFASLIASYWAENHSLSRQSPDKQDASQETGKQRQRDHVLKTGKAPKAQSPLFVTVLSLTPAPPSLYLLDTVPHKLWLCVCVCMHVCTSSQPRALCTYNLNQMSISNNSSNRPPLEGCPKTNPEVAADHQQRTKGQSSH